MPAGTDIRSSANTKAFYRKVKQVANQLFSEQLTTDYNIYAFDTGSVTVNATNVETAADELFFLQFPSGAKILDLQCVSSDMDTGANLIFDYIVETTAGVETVLITNVNGQAAATKETIDAGKKYTDVGGQYFGIKVTTGAAGGAQAGTIRVKGQFYMGDLLTGF